MSRRHAEEEFELLRRGSTDSFDLDDEDSQHQVVSKRSKRQHRSWAPGWRNPLNKKSLWASFRNYAIKGHLLRRRSIRNLCLLLLVVDWLLAAWIILTGILNPSYNSPPPHYDQIRLEARNTGYANPNNETVFIAANIVNAELIRDSWAASILDLISLLGQDNVFLSIYENDSGPETTEALRELEKRVKCNSTIVSEHLPTEDVPTITLPSGEKRIKRVAYLAEVRNRALRPLDKLGRYSSDGIERTDVQFDKILFINDVVFSPIEAAQLLFATNIDDSGRTQYRAACAVDFIDPFKFYDTFATRDLEGYSIGIPLFPWFSSSGLGHTRKDVLAEKDAVRVRSCWGGMVAFEAKWFQKSALELEAEDVRGTADPALPHREGGQDSPLRFRSESDLYWDSSECCLINADLQRPPNRSDPESETGIFINPFIRVAYTTQTFTWLQLARRFERVFIIPQRLITKFVGLPRFNARRTEVEGEEVEENVWTYDDQARLNDSDLAEDKEGMGSGVAVRNGSFQRIRRIAGSGGFCGTRQLLLLRENSTEGQKKWEDMPVPPGYCPV